MNIDNDLAFYLDIVDAGLNSKARNSPGPSHHRFYHTLSVGTSKKDYLFSYSRMNIGSHIHHQLTMQIGTESFRVLDLYDGFQPMKTLITVDNLFKILNIHNTSLKDELNHTKTSELLREEIRTLTKRNNDLVSALAKIKAALS